MYGKSTMQAGETTTASSDGTDRMRPPSGAASFTSRPIRERSDLRTTSKGPRPWQEPAFYRRTVQL